MSTIERRFNEKYVVEPSGCWRWTGTLTKGYGHIRDGDKLKYAHRVSWEIHRGKIPPGTGAHGTCVLHHCDNPACVNPAHLFLGTNAENMADMVQKGRANRPFGTRNGRAKLSDRDVRVIRKMSGMMSRAALGRKFGVSKTQIARIQNSEQRAEVNI